MAKELALALLFDRYGSLLSTRQQELFDGYYNEDLSLSELAETYGISRQGALHTIQTAERKLKEIEQKLGLCRAFSDIRHMARQIEELARPLEADRPEAAHIAVLARRIAEE